MAMADRSWHASIGAPDGWGPGPWDDDLPMSTWDQRANQFGNLRAWSYDDPREGGRVISVSVGENLTVRGHATRISERSEPRTITTMCWCGRLTCEVPTRWVRDGRTCECDGRCRWRSGRG